MRKSVLALAGGALALSALANAQVPAPLDLEVLFTGTTVNSLVGAGPNSEFDGVAVTGDGSVVYLFDSVGTFDGLLSYTSSTPAVFATEFQLSTGTNNASANDFDTDAAGNVYVNIWTGAANIQAVWRIPPTGFAGAVEMLGAVARDNVDEIEVDAANSRLVFSYTDQNGTATENIAAVPLTANADTSPTIILTETAIEAVLATLPGYVDDTADDLNVTDLTVQSDGDIIIAHGFSSNRQINGSLLISNAAGTSVSVFKSADDLITLAGGNPATDDIGNVGVEALANDEILVHVPFVGTGASIDGFIGVLSADGSTFTKLVTYAQLNGDAVSVAPLVPAGQTLMQNANRHVMDSKHGGDVDDNDNYYFYRQSSSTGGAAAENAVLRLTGVRAALNVASVGSWSLYQ